MLLGDRVTDCTDIAVRTKSRTFRTYTNVNTEEKQEASLEIFEIARSVSDHAILGA